MAVTPSGLDFSTVGEEITYFLTHTARAFMGGWSGSGENGIDVSMPLDTPVYAVESGTVKGAGYYGGGGVASVQSAPGRVWYYQHLDEASVTPGQQVSAGQLIGYSGGQNSGGNHPASPEFSSFEHIEIGINAPWSGIWGGGASVGPNVNPVPTLTNLGISNHNVPTTNGPAGGGAPSTGNPANQTGAVGLNPLDPASWAPAVVSGVFGPLGVTNLEDLLWRSAFIVTGLILFILGAYVMFFNQEGKEIEQIAPIVGKAAAAAA